MSKNCSVHSLSFKTKVALKAIKEEKTLDKMRIKLILILILLHGKVFSQNNAPIEVEHPFKL